MAALLLAVRLLAAAAASVGIRASLDGGGGQAGAGPTAASDNAGVPVADVMTAVSQGGEAPFTSYWSPSLVHTAANKTLLFAQADTLAARARKGPFGERMATSTDSGATWAAPTTVAHWYDAAPQVIYSEASGTLLMLRSAAKGEAAGGSLGSPATDDRGSPCATVLNNACEAEVGKGAVCEACLKVHAAALAPCRAQGSKCDRAHCLAHYCSPDSKPGMDTSKPVWASELPKLSATVIAACNTAISKSTDGTLVCCLTTMHSTASH